MADKAQRTLAMLSERLDRHRGAGQQSIIVKHIAVNTDNAILGDVENCPGGGALAVTHALQPEVWRENSERDRVPVAGNPERTMAGCTEDPRRAPRKGLGMLYATICQK